MFAYRLRPEHVDAVRNLFAPRKPRHPLVKLAFGLVGLALLAVLVVVGLFVGVAMLIVGMLMRLLRGHGQPMARPATDARVVDAEYRVVGKSVLPSGR